MNIKYEACLLPSDALAFVTGTLVKLLCAATVQNMPGNMPTLYLLPFSRYCFTINCFRVDVFTLWFERFETRAGSTFWFQVSMLLIMSCWLNTAIWCRKFIYVSCPLILKTCPPRNMPREFSVIYHSAAVHGLRQTKSHERWIWFRLTSATIVMVSRIYI